MKTKCKALLLAITLLTGFGVLDVWAGNEAWMANIPDNTFLSQLSIPGTHDAGTGHGVNNFMVVISGTKYAVTQEKTLTEQWNSGIRAFDLRPAMDNSRLRIYHGVISTNLYMDNALSTLCSLLDSHPTEMCIVFMRHESEGDDNNSNWGAKMKELLTSAPTSTHAMNYNPNAKLGDVRGKLLILSRDTYDTNPVGGYITGWGFNSNFAQQQGGQIRGVSTQGQLYVQDFYDVSASGAPATKTASIERMLQFSTSENTNPGLWVVNQTSGYSKTGSMFGYTFATSDGYRDNAQTQNAAAISYINSHPGPTGIILMDFAAEDASGGYQVKGQALTNAIIASNSNPGPHANYFRALTTVVVGKEYTIFTTINGKKYYLTTEGTLVEGALNAGVFHFQNGQSGDHARSYLISWTANSATYSFTNPNQNKGANGTFSGDNNIIPRKKDRESAYDCQVLMLNSNGMYAIRATNAAYSADGSWAQYAADTYWSVKDEASTPPTAGYKKGVPDYIWQLEEPSNLVNVTYSLYFSGRKITEIVVPGERGAAAALPEEYLNDFCTYTYSPKTISTGTIKVTVKWPTTNPPFRVSLPTSTARNWYNIKAGRLGRYLGWEPREPYHPHAYDEASVGDYPETELYATDLVRASDAYQWAFVGNPVEGFKIVNKLMGEDYSLTVDGTASSVQGVQNIKNAVLREGDFRWTPHADNDGFSLSLNGQENYYLNTHGGPHGFLQIWESANAKADLGSQLIAETVPAASVPLMQVGEGFYTTLCLPYDVVVNGAKVYVLESPYTPTQFEIDEKYVLLTLASDTVAAGTPVVLRGESETATLTYGNGFALQPSTDTALTGLFLPASPSGVLTLQAQEDVPGFYAINEDIVQPNRAYLMLENPDVQALALRFSDLEDGLRNLNFNPNLNLNHSIFNILGQRLSRVQKGINIVNNKKVAIK